ncbi:hypothetical protein D3C83_37210 [compost metagenome]
MPAPVEGVWRGKWSGGKGDEFRLDIRQGHQSFEGRLAHGGRTFGVKDGQIDGPRLTFTVPDENGRRAHYSATVGGGRMSGEVRDGETVIARWNATRVP